MSGVQINTTEAPMAPQEQVRSKSVPIGQDIKKGSLYLSESSRIGDTKSHYNQTRRYVLLRSSEMFASLVSLYRSLFATQWQHFQRFMDSRVRNTQEDKIETAVRNYISGFFLDLYAVNREATKAISPIAFTESYMYEQPVISNYYDPFLALLLSSIRPTPIVDASESTLYIPRIADTIDWNSTNPFGITNFTFTEDTFYGILGIMKESKNWKISTVSSNTTGRPCWLFDWHDQNQVCAWFPRNQNFNDDDVAQAYVIGVSCTPKLGPRDTDSDQYLPPNFALPENLHTLVRLRPRRFYGSYEVRTVHEDKAHVLQRSLLDQIETVCLTPVKRKFRKTGSSTTTALVIQGAQPRESATGESSYTELDPVTARLITIEDWCYYSRVINFIDNHTRSGVLKMTVLN